MFLIFPDILEIKLYYLSFPHNILKCCNVNVRCLSELHFIKFMLVSILPLPSHTYNNKDGDGAEH